MSRLERERLKTKETELKATYKIKMRALRRWSWVVFTWVLGFDALGPSLDSCRNILPPNFRRRVARRANEFSSAEIVSLSWLFSGFCLGSVPVSGSQEALEEKDAFYCGQPKRSIMYA